MNTHYFEDLEPGQEFHSPGTTLTDSGIIDFGLVYDPQRFHIDREAAARSPYGGLIASGFQTLALGFRMFFHLGIMADSSLGSPGIDELRWKAPVRPGDTIRTKVAVGEKRLSRSKPDRGTVRMAFTVVNQRDEEVMTFTTIALVACRPASPAAVEPGA